MTYIIIGAIVILVGVAYLWVTGIDNNIDNTTDEL